MPIKLKQTSNQSDQYYPLNERALSDGSKIGMKDPSSDGIRKKLTTFSKNILKSTKNLAFDITDSYVPNLKEVKNSFKETIDSAREETKKDFGPLLDTAKQFISSKKSDGGLKATLAKEKKEILDRLKQGKFYTSMEDDMMASMGFDDDFGDFGDFDFSSSSDSYVTVSDPDTLSDEPFGGVTKGRTRSVNISAQQRQLRQKHAPHTPKRQILGGGSGGSQLRLGDELVSQTTSSVGSSIIRKQDEVWARTYQADKKNFEKLYGFQNQILRGVDAIVEFNNNVMSKNVEAQLEFQGKLLAAQQDTLSSLKELKEAVVVANSYNIGETPESLTSKIASGAVGLDGKSYWQNIKKNLTDVAGSNPILSSLMMTPMMGDMLSMSQDTNMKLMNPLNLASKGLLSLFLSRNTKNRLMDFNELLSNFGGLFTGRMNMLARYGKGPAKTLGRILGARESSVSVLNNGLADPNMVVGWTSKSDRTLNEVIPTLLSKQLAVMSGGDELVYDYKDGKFKTSKSIKEEVTLRKSMAYENADTVRYTDAISSFVTTNEKTAELNKFLGGSKDTSNYMKKITHNLIKTGQMWDPELAGYNAQYRQSLVEGIPDKLQDAALKTFSIAYDQMSAKETLRFNGAIRRVNMNLQKSMDAINDDYKKYGGAAAVVESGLEEQIAEKRRSMKFDLSMQLSEKEIADAKAGRPSAHYIQVRNERMRREMEIRKLESTLSGRNGGVSATVEGFGEINSLGAAGTSAGTIGAIDKIFRLLTLGIPVYNQGPNLPDRLVKLKTQLNTIDKAAIKNREDIEKADQDFQDRMLSERNALYADQIRFKRNQQVMQNNFLSYLLPGGNSSWQQTNALNRGTNKLIDVTSSSFGKLLGSGYGNGEGLLGDVSYQELDKQNLQNATNAFIKQRDKLIEQIKADKDNPKAATKNKLRQKAVDLLNKSIESNKRRLAAMDNDKDSFTSSSKSSDFTSSFNKALGEFSNKYIMQTHDIDPNAPSIKQQFADSFRLGREALVESVSTNIKQDPGYEKITELLKTKNITSAEEFKALAAKKPALKKYTFFVSSLFSTGAVRVKDGKTVVTSRVRTITDIFKKREKTQKEQGKSMSITGATMSSPVTPSMFVIPYEKDKKKKDKEEQALAGKSKIELKMIELQKDKKSKGDKDIFVNKDGTVIDSTTGSSMQFREYKGLKTALMVNGYENANNLNDENLLALVDSISGPRGESLRYTSDYRLLKRRVQAKANRDASSGEGNNKVAPSKVRDPSDPAFFYYPIMLKNGTLRYKKLLQLLQPKVGSGIYGFSKEALFAMITALPNKTGDDDNFKAVITRTKEFKHLKSHFMVGGVVNKAKHIFEVKRNIRRATAGIRLFRYRKLLNILDMMNLSDDEGFFRNKLDDKYALKAIIEGLATSSDPRKHLVYNSIVMTKDYMNLARATVKGSKSEIKQQRKEIKQRWKAGNELQRKYGGLISVLRLADYGKGKKGQSFNFSSLTEDQLYNIAKQFALQTDKDGNQIHASIFQMAEFKELQKKYEGKKIDYRKMSASTKEFFTGLKGNDDEDSKSNKGNTKHSILSLLKYIKVVALNAWYSLTGRIKDFDSAVNKGVNPNAVNVKADATEDDGTVSSLTTIRGLNSKRKRQRNKAEKKLAQVNALKVKTTNKKIVNGDIRKNIVQAANEDGVDVALLLALSASTETQGKILQTLGYSDDKAKLDKASQKTISGQIEQISGNGSGDGGNNKAKWYDKIINFIAKGGAVVKSIGAKNLVKIGGAGLLAAGALSRVKNVADSFKLTEEEKAARERAKKAAKAAKYATLIDLMQSDQVVMAGFGNIDLTKLKESELFAYATKAAKMIPGILIMPEYKLLLKKAQNESSKTLSESVASAKNKLKSDFKDQKKTDLKNESGLDKINYLLGGSDLQNESSFMQLERGFNRSTIAKAIVFGGMKNMLQGAKNGIKTGFATAKSLKGVTLANKDILLKAVKQPFEIIKESLEKCLNNPNLLKKIGPDIIKKIKSLPSIIANKFKNIGSVVKSTRSSFKQSIKSIPIAGWAIAIADAIWSFASGMNNAPRYFNISPRDVTAGMRITSAVTSMIKSLLQSILAITGVGAAIAIGLDIIVPTDWLVQTCYKLIASSADKEELKLKQQEEEDRAKALGTDAETLSKTENHTLFSKSLMGIHAAFSKKTYAQIQNEKTAKKLGMSVNAYNSANEKYTNALTGSFAEKYPEFAKISSPAEARKAFSDPEKHKLLEAEAEAMFYNNDMKAIHKVYKSINDKKLGRQDSDISKLNPGFRSRLKNFMKNIAFEGYDLSVLEAMRNPFTQFAYYAKGRASDEMADTILALAGFGGLKYWGGDNTNTITQTLSSKHLTGNAVDFRIAQLPRDSQLLIGEAAEKHGITWGGRWPGFGPNGDAPHFENPNGDQRFALGGIVNSRGVRTPMNYLLDQGDKVRARLNPGEMVITKTQQTALFNKLKKYEREEVGSSANNPVRLNESPLRSNDKDTMVILNEALDIQKKIYNEQTRHNKVTEEFFEILIGTIAKMVGGNGNKFTEQSKTMSDSLVPNSKSIVSGF